MAKSPIQNVQAEFIDMGRTLSDIALGKNLTDDTDLQRMLGRGRERKWDQLVTEMRVVVLSVAGAGKTREIKDLARRLHAGGKPAFFIRLERIANHFELAFEPGMHKVFQEWLAGAEEGWLLLDSVDEARLRYPADFELAVQRMSQILAEAGATGRAHIVLTSRIGAWRPVTDLVLCRDLLPHPTPRSSAMAGFREKGDVDRRRRYRRHRSNQGGLPGYSARLVRPRARILAMAFGNYFGQTGHWIGALRGKLPSRLG